MRVEIVCICSTRSLGRARGRCPGLVVRHPPPSPVHDKEPAYRDIGAARPRGPGVRSSRSNGPSPCRALRRAGGVTRWPSGGLPKSPRSPAARFAPARGGVSNRCPEAQDRLGASPRLRRDRGDGSRFRVRPTSSSSRGSRRDAVLSVPRLRVHYVDQVDTAPGQTHGQAPGAKHAVSSVLACSHTARRSTLKALACRSSVQLRRRRTRCPRERLRQVKLDACVGSRCVAEGELGRAPMPRPAATGRRAPVHPLVPFPGSGSGPGDRSASLD